MPFSGRRSGYWHDPGTVGSGCGKDVLAGKSLEYVYPKKALIVVAATASLFRRCEVTRCRHKFHQLLLRPEIAALIST